MNKFRNILRETLKIYERRDELTSAGYNSIILGQGHLYAGEDGKTLLRGLFYVTKNAANQYKTVIQDFWDLFYNKTYSPYAKKNCIDNCNSTYMFLAEADKRFKTILAAQDKLEKTIETVIQRANNFKKEEIDASWKRHYALISKVYGLLKSDKNVDQNLLLAMEKLVNNNVLAPEAIPMIIKPQIEPYVVQFPKVEMPLYLWARNLLTKLNNDPEEIPLDLVLMEKPTFYKETRHKSIYNKLVFYHSQVNAGRFRSYCYSLFKFDIDHLRIFYSFFNTMLKAIYSPETTARVDRQTPYKVQLKDPDFHLGDGVLNCWSIELLLLDQCFNEGLEYFSTFLSFGYHCSQIPLNDSDRYDTLRVEEKGDNIEISLDPRLLNFAGATFAKKLHQTERDLAVEKKDHALTRKEKKAQRAEIETLHAQLAEKDNSTIKKRKKLVVRLETTTVRDKILEDNDSELTNQKQTKNELKCLPLNQEITSPQASVLSISQSTQAFFGNNSPNPPVPRDKVRASCFCVK